MAVPAEINFALHPNWAVLYPYRSAARAGESLRLELRVTNHGPRDASLWAGLALPPGWLATPAEAETSIASDEEGAVTFDVQVPPDAGGRSLLCADVTLGERRFGQIAEAIVDVG